MKNVTALFSCRLCWVVTFAVFLLILVVESVILVPSAKRFEQNELARLAEGAMGYVDSVLALEDSDGPLLAPRVSRLVGRRGLQAIAVFAADGTRVCSAGAGAEAIRFPQGAPPAGRLTHAPDGALLEVTWRSKEAARPVVVAHVDSSHVAGEVLAYTLRIAGLVAIIVLVVTAGTMVVLHFAVLRPVLRLRDSSVAAGADPDRADTYVVNTARRDEIGQLAAAHNAMLGRVAESKRRDRELAEQRARYLARHDALTGLPNRAALVEHLERGVAMARPGQCVALYLVNLRHFRWLNATLGAQRADELLTLFAARLRGCADPADFVAHLGADRYAVARLQSSEARDAAAYAERMLREVATSYRSGSEEVSVQARIGIAQSGEASESGREFLGRAELALSRTYADGGGRYQFYSAELAEEAKSRQQLTRELEQALERNELFLALQPRMALLPDGAVSLAGAEALLRWKHPLRGYVSPGIFIPLAEATGLIAGIGDFVLRSTCAQIRGWLERYGWSPRIAVNLSAQQFALPGLRQRLESVLAAHGVAPDLLEIEVTETAAMQDVARTAETLAGLRSLGVHVSIDDFGTGYSSLNYLRRFAIDAIKIDKSFVDDIGADRNAEAICDAVLRLGHSLGTRVVAEGVETEQQLLFLQRRRCDEVQGYLFGKPVQVGDFEASFVAARAAA